MQQTQQVLMQSEMRVDRSEIKYMISPQQAALLSQLMGVIALKDEHQGQDARYRVRSLYFDTIESRSYWEKEEGQMLRQKVRIRTYAQDAAQAKLEIKCRRGDFSAKLGQWIDRDVVKDCCCGNYSTLRAVGGLATETATVLERGLYIPTVMIDYEREAYRMDEFNVRITFDHYVHAAKTSRLYDGEVPMVPVFTEPKVILEVKFDRVLPTHLRAALSVISVPRMAVSKYCLARERIG